MDYSPSADDDPSSLIAPQINNGNTANTGGGKIENTAQNRTIKRSEAAFSEEANIKRKLRSHLRTLGYTKDVDGNLCIPSSTKDIYRELHRLQRRDRLRIDSEFIAANWQKLQSYFASGVDIRPSAIAPQLELVEAGTWQANLFRLASLTWSVPVSRGYGRRMRFLVWDTSNEKLIGLIGLTDPVFNLKVRDQWIGWSASDRKSRLVDVMDAFVLGAVPPYNFLLCGKLLACLLRTTEIRDAFSSRYHTTRGIISNQRKRASLALVTTSSALGRSSVYNRVAIGEQKYLNPVGFTSGWGHFHLPDKLFDLIRDYLKNSGHDYHNNHKFGDGPSWRMRAMRQAFKMIGIDSNLLKHGLLREVFLVQVADNAKALLNGTVTSPDYSSLQSCETVSELAKMRWIIPRSERRQEYKVWSSVQILELLKPSSKQRRNDTLSGVIQEAAD